MQQDAATVCPKCGWKKKEEGEGAPGKGEPASVPVGRRASYGGTIRDPAYDDAEKEALAPREGRRALRPSDFRTEMHPAAEAAISVGVGFLVAILWFFSGFISAYVPVILFQALMPIIVVPICWFFGGAFLEATKRIWAAFVCALAFSVAYAYTGWGIFALARTGEQMAAETAAVYAFAWSLCFAVVSATLARGVGWFATVSSASPSFFAVAGILGAAAGVGIEAGFAHLFGGMLYGYIPAAVTMAGLLLGAAQTGMERGW
jgi:hypothetical protein